MKSILTAMTLALALVGCNCDREVEGRPPNKYERAVSELTVSWNPYVESFYIAGGECDSEGYCVALVYAYVSGYAEREVSWTVYLQCNDQECEVITRND